MAGTDTDDPFNLHRFLEAQAATYDGALMELRQGRKRSHWMWFIFPQLRGLGHSDMAQRYGIVSLEEAKAYLDHPVLGARLRACTEAVVMADAPSLNAIFGSPDDMKFGSSMTLFALADGEAPGLFRKAIDRWCQGRMDSQTLQRLGEP